MGDTSIAGWFIYVYFMENPIRMDDLEFPLNFRKPPYDWAGTSFFNQL
jgi:hypothetical protein